MVIKVDQNSRFYNHEVSVDDNGIATVEAGEIILPTKFKTHIVKQNETLESISWKYYGTSDLSWLIAKMNDISEEELFSLEPLEGETLKIPDEIEYKLRNT